jgi:hypothetical protein
MVAQFGCCFSAAERLAMEMMLRTPNLDRQVFMLTRIAYPLKSIPAIACLAGEVRFNGSQFHHQNPRTSLRLGDVAMI